MSHYPYLIIGGGMTAAAAVNGIREVDPTSAIGLIGREHQRQRRLIDITRRLHGARILRPGGAVPNADIGVRRRPPAGSHVPRERDAHDHGIRRRARGVAFPTRGAR